MSELNNSFTNNIPFSIYIHMPWCLKKCPYCDFNSYPLLKALPEAEYTAALIKDLQNELPKMQNRSLASIFFGGGTPSLFSATSISNLLTVIDKSVPIANNLEITLEANPSTIEQKYLTSYKHAGITRISLGAQSFQDYKLKALGRIHTSREIFSSIEKIKQTDFSSFNVDLMYNLPNQDIDDALYDLQTALSFAPNHISWYELTIEPETPFAKMNIRQLNEDTSLQIQEQGQLFLQQAGLRQYEVSAYAKPQYECSHNLNYWEFGDYLGIGAGAHSKITDPTTNIIYRTIKIAMPESYLNNQQNFIAEHKVLTSSQIIMEFMLNALRLTEGFAKSLFQSRTNLPLETINAILEKAEADGLLIITSEKIIPTALGKRFLNNLVQLFATN